ncbi:MAG: hypothetical protein A3C08_03510 [Candidatus Taylorbacteria bacterium RIFCSPHIGHO2_02_FULL_47_18]|uniref:Uncharacterized protein n=1 Tax=Candidatus Taylorbacteria bacterium RIFCSPLOWO2_01_FULL_48_100 TaxID=1802322 RepID=A0A1G2NCZ7_9BACT|nr:MAG: hypothetical protein A2670_00930 [Candidatus Taylorbacteria bacterium RIFCSPHIGHO2_01_FULL_48_38]OHA28200.1 MAG: hypothetical protein A3C08_03510 [Candidatus Taylorbacteria bacterium RIFCSPHIGHO2_02_FULL_47_18]OHA33913.1 MAG: hypothetical protein A2938_02720 [Candidatus Taylorbacteria bacterium RIFCSPLOWO2_01_FULL_48_100]OHA40888.1 MAG: hypothetical protein A3J31_03730 [Candidatus Taylorbacteria bacterium RIFCSPLOWO2_02_FULL_48_16]OHA45100.1 MAG: hypothetical protein A3H13_02855 [Candid
MPNIEIHGFVEKTKQVKDAVWAGFLHNERLKEFAEEVVVTTFPSVTDDMRGRRSPFIRVFFATKAEKKNCKDVLSRIPDIYAGICFDVEFVRSEDFCSFPPKKKK